MRWDWEYGERVLRGVRAVDTATHPDWQGRGIFRRLTTEMLDWVRSDGIDFVFNTPNGKSGPGYLKMGWRSLGRVPLWLKPIAAARFLPPYLRHASTASDEPARAVVRWIEPAVAPPHGNGRAPSTSAAGRLRTPRSAEYLSWRYSHIPRVEYRRATLPHAGGSATVVYRRRRHGAFRELRLSDIMIDGDDRQRAGDLLRELFRTAPATFASAVASPGTTEEQILKAAGFLRMPGLGPELTVYPIDESLRAAVSHLSAWQLATGDLELF